MTAIDSVSIAGMKKADFEQLESILHHFLDEGIYWGRKDYFDARNERLKEWLADVVEHVQDVKILDNTQGKRL